MQRIKTIVANNNEIFRTGIGKILSSSGDIDVVSEVGKMSDITRAASQHKANVLLIDIGLVIDSTEDAIKVIKRRCEFMSVIVLSLNGGDVHAVKSLKSGASGYISSSNSSVDLVEAVRTVAKGKRYITTNVADLLAEHFTSDRTELPHEALSSREHQVFSMISSGLTVSKIASHLNLSVKTVSMYRTRMLEKLHMTSNAEVMHYSFKNGLVGSA